MRSDAPGFQFSQMGMPKAPTMPKLAMSKTATSMGHQSSLNNGFLSLHSMRSPPKPATAARAQMPGKNPGVKDYGQGQY